MYDFASSHFILNMSKIVIYQAFPRYFGNTKSNPVSDGSIDQNGCGKFNDFTLKALQSIRDLGITHVWFTGVLEHATKTDYSAYGIETDHPAVVKGKAGSPYAIKDYYDVDPDLAVNVKERMTEFEALIARTHKAGLKVLIDFVPNHLARNYRSVTKPPHVNELVKKTIHRLLLRQTTTFIICPANRWICNF